MALFKFTKKSTGPYKEASTNLIYNLIFCDDLELYKAKTNQPYPPPFDILFSDSSSIEDLQQIVNDPDADPRLKILACNKQIAKGQIPVRKQLFAVIAEIGLEKGPDVLASFSNGTARYINQSGKIIIWETTNPGSDQLVRNIFSEGAKVVSQIGPWYKPRKPAPEAGKARLSFLVSDGLYFGEGTMDSFFNDPLARPTLQAAAGMMNFLIDMSLQKK